LERLHVPHPEQLAGQLVAHYQAAGELGRAARYAEHAAAQALHLDAFVEAASYARRALEWEPTPQRRLLLGEALMTGGNAREAQVELEAALRDFEQAGDTIGMTRACILLGRIAIATSQPQLARAWLARAPLEQAQRNDPALGAQAHLLAAGVERQSEAYAAAAAQLDQATALVQMHGLRGMRAQIAFERGNLLANSGDLPAALAAFTEALRLAEGSANPVYTAMAHNNLAYHTLLAGDVAGAQAHIRAAEELTERYALSFLWQFVHSTAGEIALAQGNLGGADAALARAFEAARAWDNRIHMANVQTNQAQVALARNDRAQARALLDQAHQLFDGAADPFVRDKIARVSEKLEQLA
jgi:tetratricopeptide (TPR) repeat protein